MKNIRPLILTFALLLCSITALQAQDETRISEVKVYDHRDGYGTVVVTVTGPDAGTVEPCSITLSGTHITGGTVSLTGDVTVKEPNLTRLSATVLMRPTSGGTTSNVNYYVKVPYIPKVVRQHLEEAGMTKSEFARR